MNGAIQREWASSLGRRLALERVAHLLCEIFERLRPVGLIDEQFLQLSGDPDRSWPMQRASPSSISAAPCSCDSSGLILLRERTLTITDCMDALKSTALFSPELSLHLYRA